MMGSESCSFVGAIVGSTLLKDGDSAKKFLLF